MSGRGEGNAARLQRRAARVLAGLAGGGRLVRSAGADGAPPRYELRVAGERAPRLVADGDLIEEMRRRDWLAGSGAALAPTAAGRACLARQTARHEPFRAQHLALSAPRPGDAAPDAAAVIDNESPLAWLRKRRDATGRPLIGAAQYQAGERLRADFTRARMMPRVTSDWSGTPVGRRRRGGRGDHGAAFADAALAARVRLDRAIEAVGPELGSLLLDICCFLTGLEEAERGRGWPRRSAKVVLSIALDRLAAHYGLAEEARGPAAATTRHWGAEDYRPR